LDEIREILNSRDKDDVPFVVVSRFADIRAIFLGSFAGNELMQGE